MSKEFKITKKMMERMGTASLVGHLAEAGLLHPQVPITLLFQQSTRDFREKTGECDYLILPEYVPYCVIADVISLMERGISLSIGTYQED